MKKIICILCLVLLFGCAEAPLYKTTKTTTMMGTNIEVTVLNLDYDKAETAIQTAFDEIKRIEDMMSNTINGSLVYEINSNGLVENVPDEFFQMIKESLKYGDLSEGSFDITVQPILDLYTHTFSELGRPPTDEEVKEALELVNYNYIAIKQRDISFLKDGMSITLGGIAKGYAIDKAIEALEREGVEHALVNAGGDMRALGDKNGKPWSIALQNPRDKNDYITLIELNGSAVATSGDYERYYDDEMQFHHIVDPRTGLSATSLISVTIIADSAEEADALATSVFVMGASSGMELIESLDDVEGLIITKEKEIIKSSGFGY
ncbi:MAG: FAD:protein FMN transferase [Nanoarchaeota archaeon]|nr:FAD:protein FMN transferase [Nanoarchaeota archaeon]